MELRIKVSVKMTLPFSRWGHCYAYIVEVQEIVEVGQLDPDEIMTPGILVDKVVCYGGIEE